MSTPYAKLPAWADYGLIPLINLFVAFVVAGLVVLLVGETPLRAADILSQRLPSVPKKPDPAPQAKPKPKIVPAEASSQPGATTVKPPVTAPGPAGSSPAASSPALSFCTAARSSRA